MRTAAAFLLIGLLPASLAACGGAGVADMQAASLTPFPTSTVDPAPSGPATTANGGTSAVAKHRREVMVATDARFQSTGITGAGADEFGARDARDAYETAVLFAINEAINGPSLTKTGPISDEDLVPVQAALTPRAFADLRAQADTANATVREGVSLTFAFMTKDLTHGSGLDYRNETAPVVSSNTFGSASSSVFGKNLSVRFKTETEYRLLNPKRQPITLRIKRDLTYSMEHVGNRWLIDGWTITTDNSTPTQG